MNIHQFFNIVLLALSVATILLTILSYVLYRIRQMPGMVARPNEIVRTQGAFFKRYVPKEMFDAIQNAKPRNTVAMIELPRRIVPLFGVFVCVIFIALFVSLMFSTPSSEKVVVAPVNKFKALRAKGLLKDYELNDADLAHVTDEYLYPNQKRELARLVAALQDKRILLIDFNSVSAPEISKASIPKFLPKKISKKDAGKKSRKSSSKQTEVAVRQPAEPAATDAAVSAWSAFLNENRIRFEIVRTVDCNAHPDVLILPQAIQLSAEQRTALRACASAKVSLVATGPIGAQDAQGKPSSEGLSEDLFGIRLTLSETQPSEPTTVFREGPGLAWDLPPGLVLDWPATDGRFKATGTRGQSAALETNGVGFATAFARTQMNEAAGSRSAWLALDPIAGANKMTDAETFYRRMVLASTLAWASRIPIVRAASWPHAKAGALLISVDSEDKFENVAGLRQDFTAAAAPATFFLVSNLFNANQNAFTGADGSLFELASHSENHGLFGGQALPEQFERIQTSRHEIEEIAERRVRGFRAPEEKYDDATILSVVQNRLAYFAVNRRFLRYSPIAIGSSGATLLFPRLTIDDVAFSKRTDLATSDEILTAILSDATHVSDVGGMNLLNLHTQLTGANPVTREAVQKSIPALKQKDFWLATYSQATSWWQSRNRVEIAVDRSTTAGKFTVRITNTDKSVIEDLVVEADLGLPTDGVEMHISEQTAAMNRTVAQQDAKFTSSITVGSLQPGETKIFMVDASQ